nr:hypothetical protein [Bacillus mycoides]
MMIDQNGQIVVTYEYDAWDSILKSDTKDIAVGGNSCKPQSNASS